MQWLVDFVMRRQARFPHKVPNPSPVRTNFQGHYATIAHSQRVNYVTKVVGGANLWRPNLVGLQMRIGWNELETSKGVYDFSLVEQWLDECANGGHNCSGADGKVQLLLLIEDKSFFAGIDYFPDYLFTETGPGTGQPGVAGYTSAMGGYTSQRCTGLSNPSVSDRWDPYLATRFDLLMKAMSQFRSAPGGIAPNGFDAHPNFEGIVIQESSLGIPDATAVDPTYTADKYKIGIEAWIGSINKYFLKSRGFWFMNFIQGGQSKMDDILAWMVLNAPSCNFGGPDTLHDRASLSNATGAYQYYTKYKSSLDAACSMQNDSYREVKSTSPTVYFSMQEQFDLAIGANGETTILGSWQLFSDRVFWDFRFTPTDGSLDWSDAAAVIDAHPEFNSPAVKKF